MDEDQAQKQSIKVTFKHQKREQKLIERIRNREEIDDIPSELWTPAVRQAIKDHGGKVQNEPTSACAYFIDIVLILILVMFVLKVCGF
jgi:hypothetical protein